MRSTHAGLMEYREAFDVLRAPKSRWCSCQAAHRTPGASPRPPCDIPREPPVKLELALLTVEDTVPGLEWEVQILDQYAV